MIFVFFLIFQNLWSLDNSLKFSCLKHIQLFAHILSHGSDKILYLAYVMRAAPFVEKVEVHVSTLLILSLLLSI